MNFSQQSLLSRIESFEIDEQGVAFSFAQRLARENGWSPAFATRVIGEYKRFLFLAMAAGHPVTPSEEVDEAWHLHLTFTRSYWDRLCGDCLQAPLHHDPTQGGNAEQDKFCNWYAKTLASYERMFGEAPPKDIWPSVQVRFDRPAAVRVSRDNHWVVPKPHSAILAAAPMAAVMLFPVGWAFDHFFALWVAAAFVIALFQFLVFGRGKGRSGRRGGKRRSSKSRSSSWWGGDFFDGCGGAGGDSGCAGAGCGGGGCGGGGCGGGGCGGGA